MAQAESRGSDTPLGRHAGAWSVQGQSGPPSPKRRDATDVQVLFEGQSEPTVPHVGLRITHAVKGSGTLVRISDRSTHGQYCVSFDDGPEL